MSVKTVSDQKYVPNQTPTHEKRVGTPFKTGKWNSSTEELPDSSKTESVFNKRNAFRDSKNATPLSNRATNSSTVDELSGSKLFQRRFERSELDTKSPFKPDIKVRGTDAFDSLSKPRSKSLGDLMVDSPTKFKPLVVVEEKETVTLELPKKKEQQLSKSVTFAEEVKIHPLNYSTPKPKAKEESSELSNHPVFQQCKEDAESTRSTKRRPMQRAETIDPRFMRSRSEGVTTIPRKLFETKATATVTLNSPEKPALKIDRIEEKTVTVTI
jgi:hypothetical protein